MIEEPLFYVAAVAAVLITGISKSGFGGGLGVLAVPMMAVFIPPLQAAAILLPILCLIDLVNLWHYRKSWDRANVGILLPAGLVGVVIGTFTFRYLSDAHIRIIIGAIAVLFALSFFKRKSSVGKRGPGRALGTFWGVIAGFVSFGVHAGAPPAHVYLLPQRLPKTLFVGTMVVVFAALNYVKLVPYAFLGQLSFDNITTSLLLAPIVPLGVWLGLKLHDKVDERTFYSACYAFLVVMGVKLLYDGLTGL